MSGSTSGARFLAESSQYLAAEASERFDVQPCGSLAEVALQHWDEQTVEDFCDWVRHLRESR